MSKEKRRRGEEEGGRRGREGEGREEREGREGGGRKEREEGESGESEGGYTCQASRSFASDHVMKGLCAVVGSSVPLPFLPSLRNISEISNKIHNLKLTKTKIQDKN